LTTQLYFSGNPLNEKDDLITAARDKDTLFGKTEPVPDEPGALKITWDIVLGVK
jgi:protocatechuate 3,4-dioxygenase beta subunit